MLVIAALLANVLALAVHVLAPGTLVINIRFTRRLFDDPPGPDRIAGANAWLAARNLAIGSAEIYVMDRQGDTLAADLDRRCVQLARQIRHDGITHNVFGEHGAAPAEPGETPSPVSGTQDETSGAQPPSDN